MRMLARTRLTAPVTLAAAAATIALAASPASAAPYTRINISSRAIPAGASCLNLTDNTAGTLSFDHRFRPGADISITGVSIGAQDNVVFEWMGSTSDSCNSTTIRTDFRTAPNDSSDVWNVS